MQAKRGFGELPALVFSGRSSDHGGGLPPLGYYHSGVLPDSLGYALKSACIVDSGTGGAHYKYIRSALGTADLAGIFLFFCCTTFQV